MEGDGEPPAAGRQLTSNRLSSNLRQLVGLTSSLLERGTFAARLRWGGSWPGRRGSFVRPGIAFKTLPGLGVTFRHRRDEISGAELTFRVSFNTND